MDDPRILITYGGNWEGTVYTGGVSEMLFVPRTLSYEALLEIVHKIVGADMCRFVYDLRSMLNACGKIATFRLKCDRDVQFLLKENNEVSEVYVTIEQSQQHGNKSFVQPMVSQFASTTDSNQMRGQFHPSVPLSTQDETVEYEDAQVIPKYDPTLSNSTDSDGKEICADDKHDEDKEHAVNDFAPDVGIQHTSFREKEVGEPVQNETVDGMEKQLMVPNSKNQSIPTMISPSSSSEYVLYKGAFFLSKEDLKTTLGLLALKEKFEYRIRRSSKTRFEALCKDIDCKFQLRAFGKEGEGVSHWKVGKFVKDHTCRLDLFNDCHRQVPTKVITSLIAPVLQNSEHSIRPKDVIKKMRSDYDMQISYSKARMAKKYAQNLINGDSLPKTKRTPFAGERCKRRPQLCSRCKQHGHNRVNCTNVPLGDASMSGSQQPVT